MPEGKGRRKWDAHLYGCVGTSSATVAGMSDTLKCRREPLQAREKAISSFESFASAMERKKEEEK
jgi:hypothetical protein